MSTFASLIQRGTRAAQPAATAVPTGTLYFVTDELVTERSSGSAWQTYSPGGGAAAALVKIQQIVTAASQATVDFTSIPGTYSNLRLVWIAQELQGGTALTSLKCKVNNDGTSGNYTVTGRIGSQNAVAFASTVAATAAGVEIGALPQSGNTSIAGSGELIIPGYKGTTFHKRLLATVGMDDGTTNLTTILEQARWKNTAAITQLTLSTSGTGFTNGSVFDLYGMT
jgi:hypothetical protein